MSMTLKAARVNAGFTQMEAAKKLEISKNTLLGYENGKVVPKVNMAKKIASLYGCSVDDLNFFAD